jgi:flavin-dependent dehydrogenase
MPAVQALPVDVLVVGAGPAGAAFALNLAPFKSVLMIDASAQPELRIGESLPAAAARLLADMSLYDDFTSQGHCPAQLNTSNWGGAGQIEQDAMRNLDGHGWYLDRLQFDTWLQQVAQQRGAALLRQTKLLSFQRDPVDKTGWLVELESKGKLLPVKTRLIVDATGRKSLVARRNGGNRRVHDKLSCSWIIGKDHTNTAGVSDLVAEAGGWWYTSSLPNQGRIVAFYTDADLPQAHATNHRVGLINRLELQPGLSQQLRDYGFVPGNQHGFCAAHSATLDRIAGDGWVAVGDAAISFDPLSSQGLFNALYTGLAAAEAASRHAAEGDAAWGDYRQEISRIQQAYQQHLQAWYADETRWPDQVFWQRLSLED